MSRRKIEVVDYDPDWPQQFWAEMRRVTAVLAADILTIHHMGSTSVPGLRAKPILDAILVVRQIERLTDDNASLIELGYEAMGEFGISGRRYFRLRENGQHRCHLHFYQYDNPQIARHIDLRDYLLAHPAAAAEYGRLKSELARQFRHDGPGYSQAKNDFVHDLEAKAATWRRQNHL